MSRRTVLGFLVVTACGTQGGQIALQEPQFCLDPTGCSVTLQPVVRIQDSVGFLPLSMFHVDQAADGRVLVPCCGRQNVALYSRGGTRLGVGAGDGHPPFSRISSLFFDSSGAIHVVDLSDASISVLDENLRVVHRVLASHGDALPTLPLSAGSYLVAGQIRSVDRIGYPLHLLTSGGEIAASFGSDLPEFREDLRLWVDRIVAPSRDGKVWSVAPGRLVVEKWDPQSKQKLKALAIRSPWFEESAAWTSDERVRPVSIVEGIGEDAEGILWLLFRVAALNWKAPDRANTMRSLSVQEYNAIYDWVLEGVHTSTGKILASQRFSGALWLHPRSLLISALVAEDRAGFTIWQVYRPTFTQLEDSP
jgi:hypothetical protein